jgi:hypothetical protein
VTILPDLIKDIEAGRESVDHLPLDDPRVQSECRRRGHVIMRCFGKPVVRRLPLHPVSQGKHRPRPIDRAAVIARLKRAVASIGGAL